MLLRSLTVAVFVAGAACGGGGSSPPTARGLGPQTSGLSPDSLVDAGVEKNVDAGATDASVLDAAPVIDAPPPLAIPTDYVPAKGKRTTLVEGKAASVGHGVRVTIASAGHKHMAGGGAVGFYELKLQRGGRSDSIRISIDDEPFEAEVDALGVLLVLTSTDGAINVTTVGKTPRALDEEAAAEMIEKAAEAHGLPTGDSSSSTEHGVLSYVHTNNGQPRWRARIGVYTKRIWFLPPRAREPDTGL